MVDKNELKRIPLGSGKIYVALFDADNQNLIKTDIPGLIKAVVKEENMLGKVSGGASLEYKPTFKTYEDDLGWQERTQDLRDEEKLAEFTLYAAPFGGGLANVPINCDFPCTASCVQ